MHSIAIQVGIADSDRIQQNDGVTPATQRLQHTGAQESGALTIRGRGFTIGGVGLYRGFLHVYIGPIYTYGTIPYDNPMIICMCQWRCRVAVTGMHHGTFYGQSVTLFWGTVACAV